MPPNVVGNYGTTVSVAGLEWDSSCAAHSVPEGAWKHVEEPDPPPIARGAGKKLTAVIAGLAMLATGGIVAANATAAPAATTSQSTSSAATAQTTPSASDTETGKANQTEQAAQAGQAGQSGNTNDAAAAGTAETDKADKVDKTAASSTSNDDVKTSDNVDKSSDAKASDKTDSDKTDTDKSSGQSAKATDAAAQADESAYDKFLVQTESPQNGTQVNLFDYWLQDDESKRFDQDYAYDSSQQVLDYGDKFVISSEYPNKGYDSPWLVSSKNPDGGINKGHALWFSPGDFSPNVKNQGGWPGNGKGAPAGNTTRGMSIQQGMVDSDLVDGYPQLNGSAGLNSSESLKYLFDDTSYAGKKAFMDTKGLLHVNDDGYYYYDSTQNFASFDEGNNSFNVYNAPAVVNSNGGNYNKNAGQFFPFNSASEVFDISEDGKSISSKDKLVSNCPGGKYCVATDTNGDKVNLHHYFGVSMSTRFVQPVDGKVDQPNGTPADMTYNFSGDDDVWVFIDDTLVGDLSGIHDKASLSINFASGSVTVKSAAQIANKEQGTTSYLGDILSLPTKTLEDNTFHTLKFFYLERGNVDSNMKLEFNLKGIPQSDIIKVDQNGEPVANAHFKLYETGEDYAVKYENDPLAEGSTDSDGNLVLVDKDGYQVNFDERYANNNQQRYYVLKETEAPEGYRAPAASMHLHYEPSSEGKSGVIQSETDPSEAGSVWRTGSMALSRELVTASPTNIFQVTGNNEKGNQISRDELVDGTMFAVVLKRNHEADKASTDTWSAVTGDPVNGWKYSDLGNGDQKSKLNVVANAIKELNKVKSTNVFGEDANGSYTVTINDLPGDVTKYYWMLPEADRESETEYTIGYYFARDVKNIDQITGSGIVRLYSDDYNRQFGASLYVSNIKNQLFVQKVDDQGEALNGVRFNLYAADAVDGNGGKTSGLNPFDTVATANHLAGDGYDDGVPHFDGLGVFPSEGKKLPAGVYYLQEAAAKEGYVLNDKLVKVIVNDYGVFADAGGQNDGIKVARGVGYMLKTVSSFGASPEVDNTLTWIKASPKLVTVDAAGTMSESKPDSGSTMCAAKVDVAKGLIEASSPCKQADLRLDYSAEDHVLEYGPRAEDKDGNGYSLYITDEGIPSLYTTQDEPTSDKNPHADRQELTAKENDKLTQDLRLNALISGTTMVQVTNHRQTVTLTGVQVKKTVQGAAAAADFEFTLKNDSPADDIGGLTNGMIEATINKSQLTSSGATSTKQFGKLTFPVPISPATEQSYAFTVTENGVDQAPAGWRYDQSEYQVTVTVSKNAVNAWEAKVTSVEQTKDSDGVAITTPVDVTDHTPSFTNRYVAVSRLPLTGGSTGRSWLAVGLGLGAMALLLAGAAGLWRRRQRVL